METAETFSAPWREKLPDGTYGQEYGPASPTAHARQMAKFKNWAFKPGPNRARIANEKTTRALMAYMRQDDGELRQDVPRREVEVYRYVFEKGHSIRWTARKLQIRRESVRVYLKRLVARIEL